MLFNSIAFAIFFPLALVFYWLLRTPRKQNRFLVLASLFFYGWWDWRFCFLLVASTVVDYACSRAIERARSQGGSPKLWLMVSLVSNLGILGTFKYYDFFVQSAEPLWRILGWKPHLLSVILPVGISFYTFQTLSYTIDVYRGQVRARKSFIDVATYVSFFPQLVAGPIERASTLLPQMEQQRSVSLQTIRLGLMLMVVGYLKKVVLADGLSAPVVEWCYGRATTGDTLRPEYVLLGTYAFAFQVYGDFSGYSDIARGAARLLGFNLMINFRQPYFSRSFAEIWRRWHVSLSFWFRDYVYIPLGGNRGTVLRTSANLMLTMVLAGLWHGAAWHYVMWGAVVGCFLLGERFLRFQDPSGWRLPRQLWGVFLTFQLWTLSLIVFRSNGLGRAAEMIGSFIGPWGLPEARILIPVVFAGLLVCFVDLPHLRHPRDELPAGERPTWILLTQAVAMVCFYLVRPRDASPFIYFQF